MATPVRDETRYVTDDNISNLVQSKVKLQKSSIDTSVKNKLRNQTQIDLKTYERFLHRLTTKKNKITNEAEEDDDISNLDL
ncbi:hypothetical protein GRS66_008681 [Saccharomyces pastorianus]|nr:hypothetical protein GRS66_008681 [Saccharomyces pastorianus]